MPQQSPLSSYRTRLRWTEQEARAALAALAASRLSTRAFAAREAIDIQRLYSWRRKLAASPSREVVAPPAFVELRPPSPERVEVVLRSGIILRVSESLDGATIRLVWSMRSSPRAHRAEPASQRACLRRHAARRWPQGRR